MKKEWIVTGKTVEEARKKAAEELQLPEEELVITVLDEGRRGFLGIGAVEARISVTRPCRGEDTAVEFLRRLLADMGLGDLTVESRPGSNHDVLVTVEGDGAGVLIGRHGDTMDALQYLANLAANRKSEGEKRDYVKITLDVAGYRAKREAALRALTRKMGARVLKYKKSVMFEPMNSYERRIIHSEAHNIAGVATNSIGSDNNRRVVMYLDDGRPGAAAPGAAQPAAEAAGPAAQDTNREPARTGV